MSSWIFDAKHARRFVEKREEFLKELLPPLIQAHHLKTALDVGCGIGFFSNFLTEFGLRVTGTDARKENVEEARRRFPNISFESRNVEDPTLRELGRFDLVLCLGLLYHLENPFLAIRNLHAVTGKILVAESMVAPQRSLAATLVDEHSDRDQSLRGVALIPSEAAFVKMFYRAGFQVYATTRLPNHEDFKETLLRKRARTFLVGAKVPIESNMLRPCAEPFQKDLWRKGKLLNFALNQFRSFRNALRRRLDPG